MITIRRSADRAYFDHGWLKTYHTFSFADYYDPRWVAFRHLRVMNEDWFGPGGGFGMHPHRDMEILTYIIEGELEHRDSLGSGGVIRPGDVQRMTAGRGIIHSEFNPTEDQTCHLLQIWLLPQARSLDPSYEQMHFPAEAKANRLCRIASADGRDGAMMIQQQAEVLAGVFESGQVTDYAAVAERYYWVQLIEGGLRVNGESLEPGDAAAMHGEARLRLEMPNDAHFLLFDMA
ncbi:MAG: pirin family protein [Calditrichaeota bacterium]|nr:pirin family protein [Calditrichota bacterium]